MDSDALEERLGRLFNEFQGFQSQRDELRIAARDEFDAGLKEIEADISKVQDEQTQGVEVMKGEADAEIRRIEEQTNAEIKRIQDEADEKASRIRERMKKDFEMLQCNAEKKIHELEAKRSSRKRKYEDDEQEIEFQFSRRLKTFDRHFATPTLPDSPPPSANRDLRIDPLPANDPSTNPSISGSESHERRQEERQHSLNPLPPLRLSESAPPAQITGGSETLAQRGKKRRFEGFAKDGCATCRRRYYRCDEAKPICDRCEKDGQQCIWPAPKTPHQPARDDTGLNTQHGETAIPRATSLKPSDTNYIAGSGPDLSPAYAYDARRRPSRRLDESPERHGKTASGSTSIETSNSTQGSGDGFVDPRPAGRSPLVLSPKAPSTPSTQQPERSKKRPGKPTLPKTITFDEVYENVRRDDSREKHFIVEFPPRSKNWYIIRCDEHGMNFGEYPFSSAANHIHSEAHGYTSRTNENCVAKLGVLVLGCDAKRAEQNNHAYKMSLLSGYKPKQGSREYRKRHKYRSSRGSKHAPKVSKPGHNRSRPAGLFRPFEGFVNPTPGKIYQGAQRKPGHEEIHWCLVVCLPLETWETIGINGSLNESTLAKSIPPCYQPRLLGSSEPRSWDWALEFQNGGPRVKEREFPCLILRPGLKIPLWGEDFAVGSDNTLLCWLDAGSLRHRWYKHPRNTQSGSFQGVDDGQQVASEFFQRLEAARAACLGTVVPEETQSGHNASKAGEGYLPINGRDHASGIDVEQLQKPFSHELIEETILVTSSDDDEPESSLTPAPSSFDGDALESSYSPKSVSSDDRNQSVDPMVLDEDLDIGDYNEPPRSHSPSISSKGDASPENGGDAHEGHGSSCDGTAGSPSAVEVLRAIQAELIPGYEDDGDKTEQHARDAAPSDGDPALLFPGLPTSHTRQDHNVL